MVSQRRGPCLDLTLKARPLVGWVVQFGEGIRVFATTIEQLEAIHFTGFGIVAP